jgi:hypothetical protein
LQGIDGRYVASASFPFPSRLQADNVNRKTQLFFGPPLAASFADLVATVEALGF